MGARSTIANGQGWSVWEDQITDDIYMRLDDSFDWSATPFELDAQLPPAVIDAIRAAPASAFPHLRAKQGDAEKTKEQP